MTFSPDPNEPLIFFIGATYNLEFSYSDPGYHIVSAEFLPPGLVLVPATGNPWFVSGTVQPPLLPIPPDRGERFIRFNLVSSNPNNPPIFQEYGISIINRNSLVNGTFGCNGINTVSFDSILIEYPCRQTSTLLNTSAGNFNLLLVSEEDPIDGVRVIPAPGNNTGFEFRIVNEPGRVGRIRNATRVDPPTGFNFSFKLDAYDVIYDFAIPPQFAPFNDMKSQIRGGFEFNVVEDETTDGNDVTPPEPNPCDLSEIPRIIITSIKSDTRGENIGEYQFSVIDTVTYDGYYCDSTVVCERPFGGDCNNNNKRTKIYRTEFTMYPQIQKVLKGNVCGSNNSCSVTKGTLNQKVQFLIDKFDIQQDSDDFLHQLAFYAAARYILSGLLYGKFSVKFLLQKYYRQFLIDLDNSRFYKFVQFFTEPVPPFDFSDFFKYFLFSLDKDIDCDKLISGINCNNPNNNRKDKRPYGNTSKCQIQIQQRNT